ncbi:MAG: hypothetical protein CVT85_09525 [Alphaproteobacteria bacterium HGW-Alphaproteobacteria-7]|jgi:hypothetical protein|nr:MAG: hypothetical protein CVT85_09525 [Alphaproteobacteria bacterium HGW-Alphaproteobacteria-7]
MILRCLFAAAIALLLGGCTGWVAENRLIPVAERDPVGLAGSYVSEEGGEFLISLAEEGLVRFADPTGKDPPATIAFDMLREEQPEPSLFEPAVAEGEEAAPLAPARSYLVEVPMESDEGKIVYFYGIVRIDGSQPAESFKQFTVLCSKAAAALAAKRDGQLCIFDDYVRLRAAALDALAWHDDVRMAVDTNTFRLKSEADVMEPEAF